MVECIQLRLGDSAMPGAPGERAFHGANAGRGGKTWGYLIFVLLTEMSPLLLFGFPLPQQSFKPSDR
jgi:hypothetical protein